MLLRCCFLLAAISLPLSVGCGRNAGTTAQAASATDEFEAYLARESVSVEPEAIQFTHPALRERFETLRAAVAESVDDTWQHKPYVKVPKWRGGPRAIRTSWEKVEKVEYQQQSPIMVAGRELRFELGSERDLNSPTNNVNLSVRRAELKGWCVFAQYGASFHEKAFSEGLRITYYRDLHPNEGSRGPAYGPPPLEPVLYVPNPFLQVEHRDPTRSGVTYELRAHAASLSSNQRNQGLLNSVATAEGLQQFILHECDELEAALRQQLSDKHIAVHDYTKVKGCHGPPPSKPYQSTAETIEDDPVRVALLKMGLAQLDERRQFARDNIAELHSELAAALPALIALPPLENLEISAAAAESLSTPSASGETISPAAK